MNYVVIVLAGDDPGMNVHAIRFFTLQAATEVTDWLNSKASIYEARLISDPFEERDNAAGQ